MLQQLWFVDLSFDAKSSITMVQDALSSSTVSGGLFFFRWQDTGHNRAIYFLSQQTRSVSLTDLHRDPLS